MKTRVLLCLILGLGVSGWADDVIPSVSKEEMSAYKNAFGKAISESRRPERPEKAAAKNDNFGSKVSGAAQDLKGEILKDNKNFGSWVSKQRSERPDEKNEVKGGSESAKGSTSSGRPRGHGKKKGDNGGQHED